MCSFLSTDTPKSFFSELLIIPLITQFVFGIALTHVQDLVLGRVELHGVPTGGSLKPLDGIPSLQHVNGTTRLSVISAEGVLDTTVHVTNKRC